MARRAAFSLILATASAFPVCLPLNARAPFGLPSFTPRDFGGQRFLGALADQDRLQLRHGGHLREQKLPHRPRRDAREVAEHQINLTGHKRPQEVHVAGKSNFANTSLAPITLACEGAAASLGRSDFRPLSVSTYSDTSVHRPPLR